MGPREAPGIWGGACNNTKGGRGEEEEKEGGGEEEGLFPRAMI